MPELNVILRADVQGSIDVLRKTLGDFPSDQVEYRLSDTNVTSYLWLLNPTTGKARYYKAQRDGKIEASDLLDVTRAAGG